MVGKIVGWRLNKVLSRFSPGEPMIIPGLKPGESRKSTLQVEVYDLSNLKKVTHSGSLDVTYTYVGAYRVTVPAGTYDAVLIRWDYAGEMGPQISRTLSIDSSRRARAWWQWRRSGAYPRC